MHTNFLNALTCTHLCSYETIILQKTMSRCLSIIFWWCFIEYKNCIKLLHFNIYMKVRCILSIMICKFTVVTVLHTHSQKTDYQLTQTKPLKVIIRCRNYIEFTNYQSPEENVIRFWIMEISKWSGWEENLW